MLHSAGGLQEDWRHDVRCAVVAVCWVVVVVVGGVRVGGRGGEEGASRARACCSSRACLGVYAALSVCSETATEENKRRSLTTTPRAGAALARLLSDDKV